jgi:hypothetical protein
MHTTKLKFCFSLHTYVTIFNLNPNGTLSDTAYKVKQTNIIISFCVLFINFEMRKQERLFKLHRCQLYVE